MTDTSKEAVARFQSNTGVVPNPKGSFVTYRHYAALAAERDALEAQLAAARREALEEAAKVADRRDMGDGVREDREARRIAKAIRALIEKGG